jgi:hypothetical protein
MDRHLNRKPKEVSGDKIDYNITPGNEKIVFIKAGTGGSSRGYGDKYIKMAERIHERNGATVICASNPIDPICDASDEEKIRHVISEMGFTSFELYLIGVSDGAYQNLLLARKFPETVKWLGINTSYVEISDLEGITELLPNVYKIMVVGTKDDDFAEIVASMKKTAADNIVLEFVEGADHSFTGMLDEFIALADCI